MSFDYDFFVIGAGSGGVRASRIAAQLGAKVAVAEDLYLGGTCVNVGCVPKKLFVYASQFSEDFAAAKGFGWASQDVDFDWTALRDNKSAEIQRLNGVYKNILENSGVEIIHGRASIADKHTVTVGDKSLTAKNILIATGGWPRKPTFPGAEHVITSNEVFHLEQFPKRVLVQGGGYIAVEFAGIFNGLKCETELLYRGPLFLRGFDTDIREFVAEQVQAKGIALSFNTDITSIEKQSDGTLKVSLSNGELREVDAVFSAIGRSPKIDNIGIENTKVELTDRGHVQVDENFRTAEENIFAIGDVIGRKELTPVALAEGMALANYLFGDADNAEVDYRNIPTAVFCQPNIGTVGYTEDEATAAKMDFDVYESRFKAMKHTLSGIEERTMMKLLVNKQDQKVVGVHMVGPDAGEILQGIAVAIKSGATKADFDRTIGIHPTAAEEFVTMRTAKAK